MLDKLSEILNSPQPLEFNGKVYELRKATTEQMGEFTTWVEMRSVAAVERMYMNGLDPEGKAAHLAALAGDIAAGKYEFGGEYVEKALRTRTGKSRLLWIIIRAEHRGFTEEEANALLDVHTDQIAKRVTEMIADPKVLSALVASIHGAS